MRRLAKHSPESRSPDLGVCWMSLTGKGQVAADRLRLGWMAAGLAIASVASATGIVIDHDAARAQLFSLQLPLDALGESALLMVLPLGLSALATALAWMSCRRRSGRWGLALAAVSWVVT